MTVRDPLYPTANFSQLHRAHLGETASVLVIFVVMIAALVTLAFLAINASYVSVMRAELQVAADAASLAAASKLNSRVSGWESSREIALGILSEHRVASGLTGFDTLELDSTSSESEWNLSSNRNLIARVERGQWTSTQGFTSYEGSWQTGNPGIPAFAAANAVRVELLRPQTELLQPSFWNNKTTYNVAGSSVALRGPVDPVCAAPFAIPICSLVDGSGDLAPASKLCQGDRVFTESARYCPSDTPECGKLPTSPYSMCSDTFPASPGGFTLPADDSRLGIMFGSILGGFFGEYRPVEPHNQQNPELPRTPPGDICYSHHGATTRSACGEWGWRRRQLFDSIADHYGVIGLPGTGPITEADVLGVLQDPSDTRGCVSAALGQPYRVLHPGLQTTGADTIIWDLITNQRGGGSASPNHTSYGSTMFGSMQRHYEVYEDYASNLGLATNCNVDRRWKGICNSHRGRYNMSRGLEWNTDGVRYFTFKLFSSAVPDPISGATTAITDDTLVWQTQIPVIAEAGSNNVQPCKGFLSSASDPLIDPSKTYVVIGFINVTAYDTDIGHPPPNYSINSYEDGSFEFPENLRFSNNCNNIRGRIPCVEQYLPSSAPNGYDSPRVIM